jgi:hypothetical protein
MLSIEPRENSEFDLLVTPKRALHIGANRNYDSGQGRAFRE